MHPTANSTALIARLAAIALGARRVMWTLPPRDQDCLVNTGEAVPKLVTKYGPFYFVEPIPKGTYPGVNEVIGAAVGKTLFVTHERMAVSQAYETWEVGPFRQTPRERQ